MKTQCNLHIVSSNYVQSKNHLLHSLRWAKHTLVTLIQDQVDGLIETFERALQVMLKHSDVMLAQQQHHGAIFHKSFQSST